MTIECPIDETWREKFDIVRAPMTGDYLVRLRRTGATFARRLDYEGAVIEAERLTASRTPWYAPVNAV